MRRACCLQRCIALVCRRCQLVHYTEVVDLGIVVQEGGQQRFQVEDLSPVLEPLLQRLFAAFSISDSAENEYVMKCVMRVVGFVGPKVRLDCCVTKWMQYDKLWASE